jgi:hypothetical protein
MQPRGKRIETLRHRSIPDPDPPLLSLYQAGLEQDLEVMAHGGL